jgi:hypothetical protein
MKGLTLADIEARLSDRDNFLLEDAGMEADDKIGRRVGYCLFHYI